jgi:hypothetical protein
MTAIDIENVKRLELEDIRAIHDKRLRGLTLAARYWQMCLVADRKFKLDCAKELHGYEIFSLTQLSKIVRLNVGTIAREMQKNAPGGLLNPESLSALAHLRRRYLMSNDLYLPMVTQAIAEGTNLSTVCRLVGVNNGQYYRKLKEQA